MADGPRADDLSPKAEPNALLVHHRSFRTQHGHHGMLSSLPPPTHPKRYSPCSANHVVSTQHPRLSVSWVAELHQMRPRCLVQSHQQHIGEARPKHGGDMLTTRHPQRQAPTASCGSQRDTQTTPHQSLHDYFRVLLAPLPHQTLSSSRRNALGQCCVRPQGRHHEGELQTFAGNCSPPRQARRQPHAHSTNTFPCSQRSPPRQTPECAPTLWSRRPIHTTKAPDSGQTKHRPSQQGRAAIQARYAVPLTLLRCMTYHDPPRVRHPSPFHARRHPQ
jgi:hypothetical protein